ncbi:hypothetical protein L0F63_006179 [Massospora cicadina]|nr:hypothetical protein L0F63_006179 [Massospora cicadina]
MLGLRLPNKLCHGLPVRPQKLDLVNNFGASLKPRAPTLTALFTRTAIHPSWGPFGPLRPGFKPHFKPTQYGFQMMPSLKPPRIVSAMTLLASKGRRFGTTTPTKVLFTLALISGLSIPFLISDEVRCEASTVAPSHLEVPNPETKEGSDQLEAGVAIHRWEVTKQLMLDLWVLTLLTVGSALLTTFIGLRIPLAIGGLVNVISGALTHAGGGAPHGLALLRGPALALLRLFAAHAAATAVQFLLITQLGERLGFQLRAQVYQRCLSLDLRHLDFARSGELAACLNDDITDFKHTFKQCLTQGVRCTALLGGTAFNLYKLSPTLTAYVASLVPLVYAGLYVYGHTLRRCRALARGKESMAAGVAQEVMGAVRTVRAYAAEGWELARYGCALSDAADANLQFGVHLGLFRGGVSLALGSVILVVLYFGGQMVVRGEMQPGELMTFLVAAEGAQKALDALGNLLGQAVKASGAWARILAVLTLPPSTTLAPLAGPGIVLSSIRGEVTFRNVDFWYPHASHPAIRNLSLNIPAGSTLALVGASGAGKSTVAALLERFYELRVGEILLDGVPLHLLDPKWLRGHVIGYLPQEPTLFAGTIAENICYGSTVHPEQDRDQVQRAARAANIHHYIERLPDGYDTVVGERGATLSGGQKQRVAIARVLLKDPKVLILDEATSALDGRSEAAVQKALQTLMAGRTTLIIAHRLSTIQDAHQIVVLGPASHGGSLLEQGTHAQLLKLRGAYFNLFSARAAAS